MSFKEDDEEIEIVSEAIETLGQELLREVAQKALAVGLKPEVGVKVSDLPPRGSQAARRRARAEGGGRKAVAATELPRPFHAFRRILSAGFTGSSEALCLPAVLSPAVRVGWPGRRSSAPPPAAPASATPPGRIAAPRCRPAQPQGTVPVSGATPARPPVPDRSATRLQGRFRVPGAASAHPRSLRRTAGQSHGNGRRTQGLRHEVHCQTAAPHRIGAERRRIQGFRQVLQRPAVLLDSPATQELRP